MDREWTCLIEDFGGEGFSRANSCPICGGPSSIRYKVDTINPNVCCKLDYRTCRICAHGWIDPMPTQEALDYLYRRGSLSVVGESWVESPHAELGEQARKVLGAERSSRPGTYFELGVGKGALYRKFVDLGWKCLGVEPGDWGGGLPNVHRSIEEVPTTTRADVLVALDVLEHVRDPVGVLSRLHACAARGARIYIAVPRRRSFREIVQGRRWRMLRPLGHLHFWSNESVRRALKLSGFGVTRLSTSDLCDVAQLGRVSGWVLWLAQIIGTGDQLFAVARAE